MTSPESAIEFLEKRCQQGDDAIVQFAAMPVMGNHPIMQDVSIELGAPEIYPGQGNEIHIPKQKFFFVREKLHFLFQQCVNADCHLHEGHRTLIVFPKNAPRLTVDQIVKTEAMVSGLKETGNLLLNRLYFEENR